MILLTYVEIAVLSVAIAFSLEAIARRSVRHSLICAAAWIGLAFILSDGLTITLWSYYCGPRCGASAQLFIGGAIVGVCVATAIVLRAKPRSRKLTLGRALGASVAAALIMSIATGFGVS